MYKNIVLWYWLFNDTDIEIEDRKEKLVGTKEWCFSNLSLDGGAHVCKKAICISFEMAK